MKAKKMMVSLFLCAGMILSTAACAGGSSTAGSGASSAPAASSAVSSAASSEQAAGGPVTVSMWHSMGGKNAKILSSVIDAYNKSQSKIKVVAEFQGDYYASIAKAQAAIAAGNAPDILQTGSGQVCILNKEEGVLEDLVPYMKKADMKVSDFIPAFLTGMGFAESPEKLTAFPMGCSTPVLYANMDLLKSINAQVPTSWDEMRAVSQKLIKAGKVQYGFTIPHDPWYFWMIVGQMGGSAFNPEGKALGCLEDKTGIKAMTLYQDMCKEKTMMFGPVTDSATVCRQTFLDGKSAFFVNSCADLGGVTSSAKFKFTVNFVPKGVKNSVPTGGNSLTMLAASKHKDEAWDFIHWMYTNESGVATFVTQSGYLPSMRSMAEMPIVKDKFAKEPNYKVAFDQLQYGNNEHMKVQKSGDTANSISAMMEATLYDSEDVTKQMNTLNDQVKDILAD